MTNQEQRIAELEKEVKRLKDELFGKCIGDAKLEHPETTRFQWEALCGRNNYLESQLTAATEHIQALREALERAKGRIEFMEALNGTSSGSQDTLTVLRHALSLTPADLLARAERVERMETFSKDCLSTAEMLMTIVCNSSGGDWKKETPEWQKCARRFVDEYYTRLTEYEAIALTDKTDFTESAAGKSGFPSVEPPCS